MIPKVIHYCWFGGKPLPELAKICIASWKEYFPDYEIKEWNESNFDLECCDYVKEAYQCKKWAFVSDYARFLILYKYGGLYFDTDVEVIKPMDEIIQNGSFMGFENMSNSDCNVAPGLGMGATPGLDIYKEILDMYHSSHFINEDGSQNLLTVVYRTTNILKEHGLRNINEIQKVAGVVVYPYEYFCPIDCATGKKNITSNTISIHWYMDSWGSVGKAEVIETQRKYERKGLIWSKFGRLITIPKRLENRLKTEGFVETVKIIYRKLVK